MKLLRHGPLGRERAGALDASGRARDISAVVADIDASILSPEGIARLQAIDLNAMPLVDPKARMGAPVRGTSKVVAIGLNYSDHAREANVPAPSEPIVFLKPTTSICGPNDDTLIPRGSTKLDWEIELGMVIGSTARYVAEADALDHVAGYCLANDVSERNFQLERGSQWDKGKGCDTFCPLGPYLVTRDEIRDPQNLDMWLNVNGQRRQRGNTETMIFGCAFIVSYVSQFMTLLPGDVIVTGTPPGVGMGMKPPQFLKAGDIVELGMTELGTQRQSIRALEA